MKTLHEPVRNMRWYLYPHGDISQMFGQNKELYAYLGLNGHNGLDIVRPWAERLYAIEDGRVVSTKTDAGGYGRHIRLFNKEMTREWTYGHLAALAVNVGDFVKAGDLIGAMGNTGFVVSGDTEFWEGGSNITTGTNHPGTHLHLGLREIIEDKKGWSYGNGMPKIQVLNYDNGYKGSVDLLNLFMATSDKLEPLRGKSTTLARFIDLLKKLKL